MMGEKMIESTIKKDFMESLGISPEMTEMTKITNFWHDENEIKKVEYIGKMLSKRILSHDEDYGGVYVEVTGAQGSGKTSAMLSWMEYLLNHHPEDRVFWSSSYDAPLQFMKFVETKEDLHKIHIMVQEGSNVIFKDRRKKGKKLDLFLTTFTDFDDLWDKSRPGKCNAVFFGDRMKWIDFIHYLRSIYEWKHVFIDEFGEVAPSDQKGKTWKKIKDFSETVKEIRKCDINLFTNSQTATDIDYRVRRKIMVKAFLPGALRDPTSRVTQRAIDNLLRDPIHGNYAYLDAGGLFGRVQFQRIFKPSKKYSWEARVENGN